MAIFFEVEHTHLFNLGCVLGFGPGGKTAIIITERINIYMFDVYKFLQKQDNDNAGKIFMLFIFLPLVFKAIKHNFDCSSSHKIYTGRYVLINLIISFKM